MENKKKIFGLVGVIVTTAISTLLTQWITDREIKEEVREAIAEHNNEES